MRELYALTTLTKAALAVNEPTERCCEKPTRRFPWFGFRFDATAREEEQAERIAHTLGYKAMWVSTDSWFIFSCGAGPVEARTTNSASTAISGR